MPLMPPTQPVQGWLPALQTQAHQPVPPRPSAFLVPMGKSTADTALQAQLCSKQLQTTQPAFTAPAKLTPNRSGASQLLSCSLLLLLLRRRDAAASPLLVLPYQQATAKTLPLLQLLVLQTARAHWLEQRAQPTRVVLCLVQSLSSIARARRKKLLSRRPVAPTPVSRARRGKLLLSGTPQPLLPQPVPLLKPFTACTASAPQVAPGRNHH